MMADVINKVHLQAGRGRGSVKFVLMRGRYFSSDLWELTINTTAEQKRPHKK